MLPNAPVFSAHNDEQEPWRITRLVRTDGRVRELLRILTPEEESGDATVGELTAAVDTTQQNVSKHLRVLHDAGIVHRTKVATSVRYGIADPTVFALCEIVCGSARAELAA